MFNRIRVKLRALLPEDWFGVAGEKFRKTGEILADYSRDHIHPEDKIKEFPDLAWSRVRGEAYDKLSNALKSFEEVESSKISNEVARRTADDKVREAKASADKMESEARFSQASEFKARIELIERCRQVGVLPVWNRGGDMMFMKAPEDMDWNELTEKLLAAKDLREIPPPDIQSGRQLDN